MYKVSYILNKLGATPSTNDKKALILEHSEYETFLRVIKYALDSGKSYGIKKLPETSLSVLCTAGDMFAELDSMASQLVDSKGKLKRQGDKNHLAAMCNYLDCVELVELILKKDLRCGVGARMINGVIPDHIDIVPYERYKSMKYLNKLDWSSYILFQLKMNGLFSYYSATKDLYTTRNNKSYTVGGVDYHELVEALNEDELLVFIGEGLVLGPDRKFLPRATSNGLVNAMIQGGDETHHENFVHVVWNYITEQEYRQGFSTVTYAERFDKLSEAFDLVKPKHVRLCESAQVHSLEEAHVKYKAKRILKEEGGMVKDANKLCWSDIKSGTPNGCKMKARVEVDVKIVDAYYGEEDKQWENFLGGLVVATCDGKIQSKVGMGFSADQRKLGVDHWNQFKEQVITIDIGDITKAKNKTVYAFESASLVETRFNEKDTADTYQECVDQLAKG